MAEKTIKQLEEEIRTLTAKHNEEVEALKKENTETLEEIRNLKDSTLVIEEKREFMKSATIAIFAKNPCQGGEEVCAFAQEITKAVFENLNSK